MRRSGFGWWRLAKQVVLGAAEAVASFANTTFTAASATGTADGSTANTLTLTLRDTNNALMPSKAVTFTTELTAVDADETTLVDDAAEIATTTGTLNLMLHCYNADGTPLPNIQSSRIVYSSTGTGNTFGTPSVTDRNGQSLCTFSSTVAEAKTISVTVDGVAITQTAAVTVTGTPTLPNRVFGADWSHGGTGTGATAITDDSRYNSSIGGSGLEVIASTGLDFPSTNVLRVTAEASSTGFATIRATTLPVPAVGESLWYRQYFRPTFPDGLEDNQFHPVQDGLAGSNINWEWSIFGTTDPRTVSTPITAGYYLHAFQFGGAMPFGTFRFFPPEMPKNATYRIEWQVARISTTEFNLHVRIYDSSGVLLYDDADLTSQNGLVSLADDPAILFNDVNNLNGLNGGLNGVGGASPPFPFVWAYEGPVYVSDEGWVGPYVAGESD